MKYTKQELEEYSIHQIRTIAREVGVKSPTNQKKDALIDAILGISNNTLTPQFNNNRVGRPPKNAHENAHIPYAEKIVGKRNNGVYFVNSHMMEYGKVKLDEKRGKDYKGIIEEITNGIGIVRENCLSKKIAYLPKNIVANDKLREGDVILGKAELTSNKETTVIINVEKSEGFSLCSERRSINCLEKYDAHKIIDFDIIGGLKMGQTALIKVDNKNKQSQILNKIITNNTQNFYTLDFNSKSISDAEKCNRIVINYTEDDDTKLRCVDIVFKNILRQIEQGKDIVWIFSGFSEYFRTLDVNYKKMYLGDISIEVVNSLKQKINKVGQYESGSLTMIIVDSLSVPQSYKEVLNYDILQNFDIIK